MALFVGNSVGETGTNTITDNTSLFERRTMFDFQIGTEVVFYIGDIDSFSDIKTKILCGKVSCTIAKNNSVIVSGRYDDSGTDVVVEFDLTSWKLMSVGDYNQLQQDEVFVKIYCEVAKLSKDEIIRFKQAIKFGPMIIPFNDELINKVTFPGNESVNIYHEDDIVVVWTGGLSGLKTTPAFETGKVIGVYKDQDMLQIKVNRSIYEIDTNFEYFRTSFLSARVIPWDVYNYMLEHPYFGRIWLRHVAKFESRTFGKKDFMRNLIQESHQN